jgi:hypothetical protein
MASPRHIHAGPFISPLPPIAATGCRLHFAWLGWRACKALQILQQCSCRRAAYLKFFDDIYESDAYHSLSIEGFSVTPELIDRVRRGA